MKNKTSDNIYNKFCIVDDVIWNSINDININVNFIEHPIYDSVYTNIEHQIQEDLEELKYEK